MELILLQPLSGANGSLSKGDKISVTQEEAVRYIKKGIAKGETKKETDALIKIVEEQEKKEALEIKRAEAQLKKQQYRNEIQGLYLQVVEKEAQIKGEVLDDKTRFARVESLIKRLEVK